ncbi:hypothetical protein I7I48_06090 [Histoplasma ohiense]|nr:hypothetical protein I7I48_06090 [Histoplasma ohiense (nom. inval.)]
MKGVAGGRVTHQPRVPPPPTSFRVLFFPARIPHRPRHQDPDLSPIHCRLCVTELQLRWSTSPGANLPDLPGDLVVGAEA